MKSFTTHTLSNGLRVLFIQAPKTPILYISWGVAAGAAQDSIFGIAHLCEHLMFTGTKKVPDYDDRLLALGANNNAWTDHDRTVYEVETTPDCLEEILDIEADRWINMSDQIDPIPFLREKQVVCNELREGLDSNPLEIWDMNNPEELFGANHPYGHPIIGSEKSVASISLEDAQRFFRRWYQPKNTILCVAGDISDEQIQKTLSSSWKSHKNTTQLSTHIPVPVAPHKQHSTITIANAPPMISIQWIIERSHNTVAEIWAQLLGSEQYGLLYHSLVLDKHWAIDLDTQVYEHPTLSIIEIRITLSEEERRIAVREHVLNTMKSLYQKPLDPQLIRIIQKRLRLLWYLECEELEGSTEQLLSWYLYHTSSLDEYISSYQNVTVEQVHQFAHTILHLPYIERDCYASS
jgi:predicted Zn-dependent peptidase